MVPAGEWSLMREFPQRGQLAGNQRFADEVARNAGIPKGDPENRSVPVSRPGLPHACRFLYTLLSQFSVMRPWTRVNSDSLSVTTTAPNARPWAAIQKSFAPIGVPPLSSCALIKPYCRLTSASRGTNSICSTRRASRAAFFSRYALFSTPSSSSTQNHGREHDVAQRRSLELAAYPIDALHGSDEDVGIQ
jgi:hypothetical protein